MSVNKIEALEALPREMVGDGQSPNVFFVSMGDHGVLLISRDFQTAYDFWQQLPRNFETCLEDRQYGVIASTQPEEDEPDTLCTYDDSRQFREFYAQA